MLEELYAVKFLTIVVSLVAIGALVWVFVILTVPLAKKLKVLKK